VRVVLTHHVSDDEGGFAELRRGAQAESVHAEQDAAVHRLHAVAGVRKRACDDDAHRVIEVAVFHFRHDRARLEASDARKRFPVHLEGLLFGGRRVRIFGGHSVHCEKTAPG